MANDYNIREIKGNPVGEPFDPLNGLRSIELDKMPFSAEALAGLSKLSAEVGSESGGKVLNESLAGLSLLEQARLQMALGSQSVKNMTKGEASWLLKIILATFINRDYKPNLLSDEAYALAKKNAITSPADVREAFNKQIEALSTERKMHLLSIVDGRVEADKDLELAHLALQVYVASIEGYDPPALDSTTWTFPEEQPPLGEAWPQNPHLG